MKAIVSSKALFDFIDKATENEAKNLLVAENKLIASGEASSITSLTMTAEIGYNPISCPINWPQLFSVRQLLKQIPEQPIVIEIDQIEDDKISIELSQLIARF